jgi:four helix bundle protein
MIKSYKDLEVYKTSYKLAFYIHKITKNFPEHEIYEIGSQLRRSSLSIALNIAEGYGKQDSAKEFKRYLNISLGSCNETMVLIDFIKDLNYINEKQQKELLEKYQVLAKRIYTLIEKWK